MVKVFESAPRDGESEDFPGTTALPFVLPGDPHVYSASVPKRAVWQRTQLASRANVGPERKIAALLDFLAGSLTIPGDRQRLEDRLLDGADTLDLVDVFPVVTWLTNSWSAQMEGKAVEGLDDQPEPTPEPVASPLPSNARVIEGSIEGSVENSPIVVPAPTPPAPAEVAQLAGLPPVPPTA